MEQIYRIGIDHGYGNIKTAHHIFESGVIERERASELAGMTVEFEGKFYEIGSTHKEYQMDKVWDEDYYILTLAALAKELKGRGLCNASVILAVGLPIKWLGEQGEGFRKYLLRNKEVTFRCNDTRYHVKIEDVEVYAQGFAAVAADLSNYQGFNIVADIGNGTMNVIFIIDEKPDSSRYYTERFGVECCVIEMRSELTNKVHTVVDDCIVKKVLKDGTADIGEKYLKAIAECASDYTDKIMRKLREYGYNEELAKLHFLGGGAMLMKHFAKLDQNKVHFIEDIHANANTANAKIGSMDIKVTVTPMQNQEGCLKASASALFNNVFKVTGIRIGISQKGNIFVSMPDYKTGKLDDTGKDIYQDIAYPVTRQFRQELYDEVVKEFHAVMEQETHLAGEE